MLDTFKAARKVSVPLVVIHTSDQSATVTALAKMLESQPVLMWDHASGVNPLTDRGAKALAKTSMGPTTCDFTDAMVGAVGLPQESVMIALNAHRQLNSTEPMSTSQAVQAVQNLRDKFKMNFRMLVMLMPEGAHVPGELDQDIVALSDPLPDRAQLTHITKEMYASAKQTAPENVDKAVEALSGLSQFAAEQVLAMSFNKEGLNVDMLWERKRVAIEQTPGLRVHRGAENFSNIVGLHAVKARFTQRLKGRVPIGCVVWLDEIDKVFANVEHDSSGVRMDQLRTLLTEMENNEWEGAILAGLPGGGKSLLGKALGNEAGVPTIALDLAAMEGSLVGESEQRLRKAMAVIKAVGGGNAYVVATSNNATVMRPELQRRFTGGFFFFDLMSAEERMAAWTFYMQKYSLPTQPIPTDSGWTAAEIRNCAREAWNSNVTLVEAAKFIVPVAQARADEFEDMRKYANGRYLDASKPGVYRYSKEPMEQHRRAIDVDDLVLGGMLAAGMKKES